MPPVKQTDEEKMFTTPDHAAAVPASSPALIVCRQADGHALVIAVLRLFKSTRNRNNVRPIGAPLRRRVVAVSSITGCIIDATAGYFYFKISDSPIFITIGLLIIGIVWIGIKVRLMPSSKNLAQ